MIILLFNEGSWKQLSRRKKFKQDFGNDEEAFNDDFKIGIAVKYSMKTQKAQLKLYEEMYSSDIIVASPLALRLLTG
jgi:hypothetical protein